MYRPCNCILSQNYYAMKNILIPTDFSDTSKDAFLYAQSFVEEDANFMVLHAFHPQVDPAYPYLNHVSDDFYKAMEKQLKEFASANHPSTDGSVLVDTFISPILKIGLVGDVIRKESEGDTDLIVMGRTGSNSVFEKVFGTVSTSVAQHAYCPVLLVPKDTTFKGVKKVLFATNKDVTSEEPMIRKLLSVLNGYRPEIHFVQVQNDIFNYYDLESEEHELLALFKKVAPGLTFKITKLKSDDAMESLFEYAKEEEIDLISLVTEHRDTISQLFHRSMTKRMILNSKTPLLVMHYDA